MTTKASALARADRFFSSGAFRADLARLVGYPTESQTPGLGPALQEYLEQAIAPRLGQSGYEVTLHENPAPGGGPILVTVRTEDPDLPTVLTYAHGDVINGQQDAWRDGLTPFRLIEDGDRFYGRGTADNKGQHLINIAALEAVLQERGTLGFNSKFIIETSEEIGSPGLNDFCENHRDLLAADVLIASDGPRLQPQTPTIFMGARGSINFDLEVHLRDGAHHSGNWGGLLADPAIILAHAIASITDQRGQIRLSAWRPDSLIPSVRTALATLPMEDGEPAMDHDWGEVDLTPAERVFGWNAFAVLAMTSGVPEAPQNAISGAARATCQLRFVVGTPIDDVLPALRRHLDAAGFDMVTVNQSNRGFFDATRLELNNPWADFVASSVSKTAGKQPHILPNLAGSLPNHCFADTLGLPTIWIPHSYRGCNQHAPDEHVLAPLCRDALKVMTGLFWDIGELGGPYPSGSSKI